MPHRLVTALNIAVGAAAGAILVVAVLGPVAPASQAGWNPLLAATVVTHQSSTTAHQSSTTTRSTRTTRTTPATSPSTSKPTTTLPVTVAPTVPHPTTVVSAPRHVAPRTAPATTAPTTSTTSTTIAPIGGHLPEPPSTLPLRTKVPNAHVSPVFAALSGAGFFVALVIMATRFVLTRPGRKR